TSVCHLLRWHPSPCPPTPPSSNHLCHTNTPSCPSAARAHDCSSSVTSARLPVTTRGPG
ncbi:hypothetical protein KUCAC02_006856, partial [Chaenocephalus aceratus]